MKPESAAENMPAERSEGVPSDGGPLSDGFPIVGVGASAGGLAAFEAFFSGMPATTDPGMAFVLVQHLAPDHHSILSDLVRRCTRMQVFEVEDGMQVANNCAYIIPPNRDMAFSNGTLQLVDPVAPRGQRLPIDHFFRSLAHDQRDRAIGVVLSGTGSDGTLGVRAIKGEGGMVMAQTPESAEFEGMPRNAIATGLVDFELTPAEMPARLIAYARQAFGKHRRQATREQGSDPSFGTIITLLRNQTGHDFSQYKPSTIQRRIERRMAVHQIETADGYAQFVQHSPGELDALFRDMLIGVTRFFRDREAFEALEQQAIPRLLADQGADGSVRIWVPGCSTGEEAYSLAILLAEELAQRKQSPKIQVFATDIDSQALAVARTGIYPASIATDLTPERLARFFSVEPGGGAYRVNKRIRSMLIFSEHNLIRDPPFSRLDLISCRNLLIYLNGDLKKKLIPLFHYALNRDGFLFLGSSESVSEFGNLFSTLERRQKIYQRKDDPIGTRSPAGFVPQLTSADVTPRQAIGTPSAGEKLPLRKLTEQALLEQVVQVGALVNADGDLFYLHGHAGMYLEPAIGESGTNNILKMAREGLRRDLTIALHKTARTGQISRCPVLRVRTNGDFSTVTLTVRPVMVDPSMTAGQPLFLVILERTPEPAAREPLGDPPSSASVDQDAEAEIARLRRELGAKEDYLQSVREELESSNEEMQSVNEELQSTNEELETSKEELQSVNEELSTVNAELQTKVADLSQTNNDMNNLLAGTGIATIFVDHELKILRFTPASTQIINLIMNDVGRPISHIVSNLVAYDTLSADIKAVLDTLDPRSLDVESSNGQWYRMRIQPYRTIDNVVEGAVISFVDITETKQAHEVLRANEERLRVALDSTSMVLSSQDRELRYTWMHDPRQGSEEETIIGKTDQDLFPEDEGTRLISMKRHVLKAGTGMRKNVWMTIDGQRRLVDLTLEPLHDDSGAVIGLTSAYREVTPP